MWFLPWLTSGGEHTVGSTRHRYTLSGAGVASFLTLLYTDNNSYSISVPIEQRVLNKLVCRCAEKNVMANHIAGSGDLNFFQFILSELIIKCAIRFGRFVRILEAEWKKIIIFNVDQQNKVVCRP
jgi:hypothetical protein